MDEVFEKRLINGIEVSYSNSHVECYCSIKNNTDCIYLGRGWRDTSGRVIVDLKQDLITNNYVEVNKGHRMIKITRDQVLDAIRMITMFW